MHGETMKNVVVHLSIKKFCISLIKNSFILFNKFNFACEVQQIANKAVLSADEGIII